MWLAEEIGRSWITRCWHSMVLVGAAILNVIDGGRRSKPVHPPPSLDLQSVLQSLPEAVFIFDVDACTIDINQAAEQLTGQTRDELLGENAVTLFSRVTGGDLAVNPEPIVTRTLRGEFVRHERRIFRCATSGRPTRCASPALPCITRPARFLALSSWLRT